MRRRQATASAGGGDNGIFIIGHVDGKGKYGPRQRWNLCNSLMAVLGVLIIAGYLMLSNHVLEKQRTPPPPQASDSIATKEGPKAAASLRIPDPPAAPTRGDKKTAARPPPPKETFNPPVRIPRRLIFTYKYNLLAPAAGALPMAPKDPLTANVLHTIDMYEKQWKELDAKSGVRGKETEEIVVSFLSDEGCVDVIQKTEPRLVDHFTRETRGDFKADICRVAELSLYGGYYFDIDIGVVEPLHDFEGFYLPSGKNNSPDFHLDQLKKRGRRALTVPTNDDIVTFASIFNGQGRFFQAFTAATPKHPVLKKALDYMVGYYQGTLEEMLPEYIIQYLKGKSKGRVPTRERPGGMGAGPFTLSIAHRSTTDEEWEEHASGLMKEHGYTREKPPDSGGAKLRYSRYLFEASLESDAMKEVRAFTDIPLQDAIYEKKVHWCNFVCFAGHQVYFYSRVPGSKGCPEEKRMKPPYH